MRRKQQNVVECQGLFGNAHRVESLRGAGSGKSAIIGTDRLPVNLTGIETTSESRGSFMVTVAWGMLPAMPAAAAPAIGCDVYTVSRLNREARLLLENGFPLLWLEGELSNFVRPASGHLYFSLKDAAAQVRCAMFRNRNQRLNFEPESGMQVLVRAQISLYEPRGDYQLIVEHMEVAGDGALRRAFEALKQRLAAEGLFDAAHKQPLPALPKRIGVITSPTGAAIRDILSVLKRRFPAIPVLIYPVAVQGAAAAAQIAAAIARADRRKDCDVLIVARGGGSLEDLWPFNEEVVARAIYACSLPVVSGVGHEIDFTIADFVADQRAPTPSVAAEMVSPDQTEWLAALRALDVRLAQLLKRHLHALAQRLEWIHKRLAQQHPGQRLRQQAQRLDDLEQRLRLSLRTQLRHREARLVGLNAHLLRHSPAPRIRQLGLDCSESLRRLHTAVEHRLSLYRARLSALMRELDAVSPLATLERGYAIVTVTETGKVVYDASEMRAGDRIEARLAHGSLSCTVDEVHWEEN